MRRNLSLLLGSVLVSVLLFEGGLRVIGYSSPSFYGPDPELGFGLRPGAEGWWQLEGESYVTITPDGRRDRVRSIVKPKGVLRVAVLGDSYSEAMHVPIDQTYWSVAEQQLNSSCPAPGVSFEFLNFGVAGYGTAQELLSLRHKALPYDPDIVLLAFFTGNDVRNNSRALEQDSMRPYFELDDGALVLDHSFLEDPGFRFRQGFAGRFVYSFINRSRLLQLVNRARYLLRVRRQLAARGNPADAGLSPDVYGPPEREVWKKAWEVTEALIRQMAREAADAEARFVIMTMSTSVQVHPDPDERARSRDLLGADDLTWPDRRVREIAESVGALSVMSVPPLLAWAQRTGVCVHGFANATACGGHWNAAGHRVAGEWLAESLCRSLS